MKLAEYLYQELHKRGVDHAFGIPGDFALSLWAALEQSPIRGVVLAHEPAVGFAADAYARVRGMGLALVTYGVGGLNMVNPTAEAYAERSPLVVLSGCPGIGERHSNPLLHHTVKTFDSQRRVFEEVTQGAFLIDNPLTAAETIQKALKLVDDFKRPVYIEIPRDLTFMEIPVHEVREEPPTVNQGMLRAAVDEAVQMILNSERPAILGCVEMHRFGLQKELLEFAEKTGIPVAATMLGKGVFPEDHPLYMGIYVGGISHVEVEEYVEGSDCLLMLGTHLSDFNMGIFTADLKSENAVHATAERIRIKYHEYHELPLQDFIRELLASPRLGKRVFAHPRPLEEVAVLEDGPVSMIGIVVGLNQFLKPEHFIVTDVGDCLFAGIELQTKHTSGFLSPAYYLSMGFGVPATIGVQVADPKARPILLIGDGAFQMMGMELINMPRLGLNPIIVLLNNASYSTLKFMNPESPYLSLAEVNYAEMANVFGGNGFVIKTNEEFVTALNAAQESSKFSLLDVRLSADDTSNVLKGLARENRRRIGVKE